MKIAILGIIVVIGHMMSLSDAPFIIYKDHASRSCQDAITQSLLDLNDLSGAFYVLSNGKFLNNWGSYDSCMKSALGSSYWMVTISGPLTSEYAVQTMTDFRTGLCVPQDCTTENLEAGLNSIFIQSAEFAGMTSP